MERRSVTKAFFTLAATFWLLASTNAAELVMLEQDACPWCERWQEEIGVIYAKTSEGKRAPIRRIDIHDPLPKDLEHLKPGRFTPTFILVEDGKEIDRIRGYPGEDFFWGLLSEMIKKLTSEPKTTG